MPIGPKFGHNRDAKRGKQPIVIGLLCTGQGCPIAVEVFAGNSADPSTVAAQVAKLRERFNVERIALVGDRGMLTTARIREIGGPGGAGLDLGAEERRSAQAAPAARRRASRPAATRSACNPTRWPRSSVRTFPGERLVVCLNPRLAQGARAQAGRPP